MKPATVVMCLALLISATVAIAESPKQAQLESELKDVWRQPWPALNRNDAKAYAAFLAEDVLVPANRMVYDKKALIELARVF